MNRKLQLDGLDDIACCPMALTMTTLAFGSIFDPRYRGYTIDLGHGNITVSKSGDSWSPYSLRTIRHLASYLKPPFRSMSFNIMRISNSSTTRTFVTEFSPFPKYIFSR